MLFVDEHLAERPTAPEDFLVSVPPLLCRRFIISKVAGSWERVTRQYSRLAAHWAWALIDVARDAGRSFSCSVMYTGFVVSNQSGTPPAAGAHQLFTHGAYQLRAR